MVRVRVEVKVPNLRELQLVEHEDDAAAAPQQQPELRVGYPAAPVVGAAPCCGTAPLVGEQGAVPHAWLGVRG